MEREPGTIASFNALGYKSDCCRTRCKCDELPCPVISWLVSELRKSCPEVGGNSGTVLAGELKEILRVMFYPYDTSETLTPSHLQIITDFLLSELQAAHILKYQESHPDDHEPVNVTGKEQRDKENYLHSVDEIQLDEGDKETNVKELAELFEALNMDPASQLDDVYPQVESRLALLPEGEGWEPLLKTTLSPSQWSKLQQINHALSKDYESRRQMMIMRFHVTLQSFSWGEHGKERSALMSAIPPLLAPLESSVSIALLLAAREDQSRILPVTAGQSTAIHKILMGSVPDRGGRPGEIEPPMPMFTRRSEGGDGHKRDKNKFKREYSGKKNKKKQK